MNNTITGQDLKEAGMNMALDNADHKNPDWSQTAYEFLIAYATTHSEFMTEDVREAAKGIIDTPPSERAWGCVIVRAAKNNIIQSMGFAKKKRPEAHLTPAIQWLSKIYKVQAVQERMFG